MRVAGVLAGLTAIAWTASAGAEPDEHIEHDACDAVPRRSQLGRYDLIGDGAIHAVARTGEHYVIYPHGDPARDAGCEVYPLLAAAARVEGHFGFGTQAYALRARSCGGGDCPTIVALRGKSARALLALRTGLDCDVTAELRPIKLFPRRDVFELICRNSAGAGSIETVVLFDATDDAIAPIFQLETGSYSDVSPDEARAGACPMVPVGSLRIEKSGAIPLLRVIDPKDGPHDSPLVDGRGTLPARQLAYDPAQRRFAPTRAPPIPTRIDAHRCRSAKR